MQTISSTFFVAIIPEMNIDFHSKHWCDGCTKPAENAGERSLWCRRTVWQRWEGTGRGAPAGGAPRSPEHPSPRAVLGSHYLWTPGSLVSGGSWFGSLQIQLVVRKNFGMNPCRGFVQLEAGQTGAAGLGAGRAWRWLEWVEVRGCWGLVSWAVGSRSRGRAPLGRWGCTRTKCEVFPRNQVPIDHYWLAHWHMDGWLCSPVGGSRTWGED